MNVRFANILGLIMIPSALLLSTPVKAETESPEFRACMDAVDLGAFKNSQWIACYEAELKRQDRNLNSTYQQIQKSAPPELRQALVKGQRAWVSYRDAWCSYEELAPVAPGGNVNKVACLTDVTISQINRLKNSLAD
jgi:uncharacterized protein YecT (DUF1311 family)